MLRPHDGSQLPKRLVKNQAARQTIHVRVSENKDRLAVSDGFSYPTDCIGHRRQLEGIAQRLCARIEKYVGLSGRGDASVEQQLGRKGMDTDRLRQGL